MELFTRVRVADGWMCSLRDLLLKQQKPTHEEIEDGLARFSYRWLGNLEFSAYIASSCSDSGINGKVSKFKESPDSLF